MPGVLILITCLGIVISQKCNTTSKAVVQLERTMMIRKWYLLRSTETIEDEDWINCLSFRIKPHKHSMRMALVRDENVLLFPTTGVIGGDSITFVDEGGYRKVLKIMDIDYYNYFLARQGDEFNYVSEPSFDYTYFPLYDNYLKFEVKAEKQAKIALTVEAKSDKRMYEFYLNYANAYAAMKIDLTFVHVLDFKKRTPINKDEFVGFWIRYTLEGNLSLGFQNESYPFLTWIDDDPIENIAYFGVSTLEVRAEWKFFARYYVFSRCPEYREEYETKVNAFCGTNTAKFNWAYKIEDCNFLNHKTYEYIIKKW